MKLSAKALLLVAFLALPGTAWAQGSPSPTRRPTVADTVTGVDTPPPGMEVGVPKLDPAMLKDYIRAVEALDMAVEFQAGGASRGKFGTDRIKVTSSWERKPGASSAQLASMEITPVGGRLEMGGMKINKIKIDRDGKMRLDIHRFPDVTVSKITKDREGNVRLHIDWLPDITIKNDGSTKLLGFIGLGNVGNVSGFAPDVWPPRLEDVMAAVEAAQRQPRTGSTPPIEGTVSWDIRGRASAYPVPIGDGRTIPVASRMHVRGAAEIKDGQVRTVGDGNTVSLTVNVGAGRIAHGPASLDVARADVNLNGKYDLHVNGPAGPFALNVDGTVDYTVDGRNITVNVPSGTTASGATVSVANARLVGDTRLRTRVVAGQQPRATLRDGHYKLDINGPIRIDGVRTANLTAEDVGFNGTLTSEGTYEALTSGGSGLNVRGNLNGELTADAEGMINVLVPGMSAGARVERGSTVRVALDEVTGSVTHDPSARTTSAMNGTARGRVTADLALGDVSATTTMGTVHAPSARVNADVTVDGSTREGLRSGTGTARVTLDEDASVRASLPAGQPGSPASRSGTYTVVAGDTLSGIARRHGTTVAALKRENGLTSDTIRVGDRLKVPGAAPSAPTTAPGAPGTVATTIAAGTEVSLAIDEARSVRGGVEMSGTLSAKVVVKDVDLKSGLLEAKILGAARANLETRFRLSPNAAGTRPVLRTGQLRVPVRIEIGAGSRVQVNIPGKECDVTIDRPDSYAEFTVLAKFDESGLHVDELAECDLLLVSTGAARFAGGLADVPGEKSIRYQGKIVLRDRGLDLYGDITVRVRGPADRPIIRINW
jgi:LysM repeat protein